MRATQREIAAIMASQGGVIARRDHPDLATSLAWLHRTDRLTAVLPGVYAQPAMAGLNQTRIRAAMLWDPDAVLVGATAASVSFWSNVAAPDVCLSVGDRRISPPGFQLSRRQIAPELIRESRGLRFTTPDLTALDLCETMDGDGIDTALRTRAASLGAMRRALELSSGREGNVLRRRLLLDSRDNPWSRAERLAQRLLRSAKIKGWEGNLPVRTQGQLYFIDVAFEGLMLAMEIDGRLHEDDQNLFESDRWRQNALAIAGWTVIRFTWIMLKHHPDEVVRTVRQAIELQEATIRLRASAVIGTGAALQTPGWGWPRRPTPARRST